VIWVSFESSFNSTSDSEVNFELTLRFKYVDLNNGSKSSYSGSQVERPPQHGNFISPYDGDGASDFMKLFKFELHL
jgi:hypothetical protein